MTDSNNLPKEVEPHDRAAAIPPDETKPSPNANAVRTQTMDKQPHLTIGEGSTDEMDASGAWISSDTHYDVKEERR